jgi:hypothetical protein
MGRIECPVRGCTRSVERQRRTFRREERFLCPEHEIYISPSTYEHRDYRDNLLPSDPSDLALLERVFAVKRETNRVGRERSEDALTFNVFRTLERLGALDTIASEFGHDPESGAIPSYWSFSLESGRTHPLLAVARAAFGERDDRGSEPDLLIETRKTLFVIEAKLGARNETTPSSPAVLESYRRGADGWYEAVFRSEPALVAQQLRLYQPMRLWLLGSWMASQSGRRLVLVNLTRSRCEQDIERRFFPHIVASSDRHFVRSTWESIRERVRAMDRPELDALVDYLDYKTLGFDGSGALRLAFESPRAA